MTWTVGDIEAALGGGPIPGLTQAMVDAALGQVRGWCRWHVTPNRTETLTLDADGAHLHLPSLRVTGVASVTNADTGSALTGWRWSKVGSISGRWPQGFRRVTVEFTHGYDPAEVPEVLMVVAQVARRMAAAGAAAASGAVGPVSQEAIGTYSQSFDTSAFTGSGGGAGLTVAEQNIVRAHRLGRIE